MALCANGKLLVRCADREAGLHVLSDLPAQIRLSKGDQAILQIREVKLGDEFALAAFYRDLSPATKRFFHPYLCPGVRRMRRVVEASLREHQKDWVAVTADGKIVGHSFLWDIGRETPELGLGIADLYQNQGLGHIFIQLLIDYARSIPAHRRLCLTVYEENARAQHLYHKFGFICVKRERVRFWPYPGLPCLVVLHMELEL